MLPSRGTSLAGNGLRCIRPIPPRLQGTRQLSQCSASRSLLFSRTPARPIRPSHPSLATIGRANISLWPWGSKKEGLGFSPPPTTREGTPEPSLTTDTPQPLEPSNEVSMDPTPLPLESADDSILAAIQTPMITEDHYGFLREMGLNYGFPYIRNTLEIIMENIHVYAGTEWWATIALSAIAVRALMVVPMAIGSHHTAKLEVIKPHTKEAKERLAKAQESNDLLKVQEAKQELHQLIKAVGYKMAWPLAPMVLQGLFGFSAFQLMRAMTALPVPGLETGGALWFMDLTVRDPYFIFPVVMGGLLHLVARMGGELAQSEFSDGMRRSMLYYLPSVMAVVVAFQPAALQVSFLTATIWGVGQSYLFRRAWFRKFFKMEPLPDKFTQSQHPGSSKEREIATGNIHQYRIAPPASGKSARTLRTVSPLPLKYEAPRARAQREMANFHPPNGDKTKKSAAPSKGLIQTTLADATKAQENFTGFLRRTAGMSAPPSPKQQRAEEYERRRRTEKKYEAETRRQGKH